MATFNFTAKNKDGAIISGHVEAASRDAAVKAITLQGHQALSVDAEKKLGKGFALFKGKVKSGDLVIFTRQLSTMVSAGVPLMRALTTLSEQAESPRLKEALQDVTRTIQSGISLGDAFAKHPDIFSDIYINMVRAGEAGGILDDILKRLALQQEKNDAIKKKVKSAMTYPVILMMITVGAFFGLMLFVIPNIGKILYDLGGPDAQLPMITKIMLAISAFMTSKWYLMLAGMAAAFFGIRYYLHTPIGRATFHKTIIKIPGVGPIIVKVAVARFARTFASLIGAGVSMLEALRVTANAVGNDAFKEDIMKGSDAVKAGQPLSGTLEKSGLFPSIVPQMLAVGEETGQTSDILVKVAEFYEEEVDAAIASISSIIEPVMIVVMGGLVGLIAVSVMGPIASLSQNIK